jgi:transcriptional regulator with XRE-family HTH domain
MDRTLLLFGEVISQLRRNACLSQEMLADRAGIHRTYISQLERGLKSPTLAVLMKIAAALDVRASEILILLECSINELPSS